MLPLGETGATKRALQAEIVQKGSGTNEQKRRSRQNVIFELGFFYAGLERRSGRVILLHKGFR